MNRGVHHHIDGRGGLNVGSNLSRIMDIGLHRFLRRLERILMQQFVRSPMVISVSKCTLADPPWNWTYPAFETIEVKCATQGTHKLSRQWLATLLAQPGLRTSLPIMSRP